MIKLLDSRKLQDQQSLGITLNHKHYMVIRKHYKSYVYENICPHLGVNLEFQANVFLDHSGDYIQCSSHGALFEIDSGLCIWGPCINKKLKKVASSEFDGAIWLI